MDGMENVPRIVRLIIAAMPGFAIVGFFWAIGRLIIEEKDEFMRMLTIRQILISSALALSAASVWGFLESADLVMHLDGYWYAVICLSGRWLIALNMVRGVPREKPSESLARRTRLVASRPCRTSGSITAKRECD